MFDVDDESLAKTSTMPGAVRLNPDNPNTKLAEDADNRHAVLMQCLREEKDLQAEERLQMAIDEDYYDHLQWKEEDARILMGRGQAPLVFNESRQSIDWAAGMQKRQRTDAKVLPREPGDEKGAEVKGKVMKYAADVNLHHWHVSKAYKQMLIAGLSWLEEGINSDPSEERIYSGSEDWRNVYRDSRAELFDFNDARYQFRTKVVDLDYACALLPYAREHLKAISTTQDEPVDTDDIWYLGERLTGSTDLSVTFDLPSQYRDRSAFIGGARSTDVGRRRSVRLLETYYKVPESVQVFADGPLRGKTFDSREPAHAQLANDRWKIFDTVRMRMRAMVCTESAPMWDGWSPFRHNRYLLIPVRGYRRYRDGQFYGLMRGMRDLNDDLNKRASKSMWAANSNRVVYEQGAFEDVEEARDEIARPDMALEVGPGKLDKVRFEKPLADMQGNLELVQLDRELLRNAGGVTDANLGRDGRAVSGKAIGLQQDQGSLTTSELPDNLRLALQVAGKIRLSHIEQFMTERQVIRLVGDSQPIEWLTVNDEQDDGTVLNDITEREADFIIAETDFRASHMQAALAQVMELLGQLATFAPQVVLSVLDLVVEAQDIPKKDEWIARIRKINGQRDPSKQPTPEEQARMANDAKKAQMVEELQLKTAMAQLAELEKKIGKLDVETMSQRVEALYMALQAGQIVASVPAVAPVADEIAVSAGFEDQAGTDPNLPQPAAPANPATLPVSAAGHIPPAQQADGAAQGIETPQNDGVGAQP